jgi:hypothetical protein
MTSRISSVSPYYSQFENILPDELTQSEIKKELEIAKNELEKIIEEDLLHINNLLVKENKTIEFNKFLNLDYIIKRGFYHRSDASQDKISFYYAHWTMSLSTLRNLAQNAIEISEKLKKYYINYINHPSPNNHKRIAFNDFVRTYQDFYGYLISIHNTITQYYDLFVRTSNEIDPESQKSTIIAYISDIGPDELLSAVKELLLHGNKGRLAGLSLIRSAVEVFVTRKLFDTKNSKKFQNRKIIFVRDIPSLSAICKRIEDLKLDDDFKTDSVKRLYAWESIVAHRGIHSEEYLIWFVYHHAPEIINAFNDNLEQHGDKILEELQKDGIIKTRLN